MEKKILIFVISALLLAGTGAFATDNVGTSAANFLKMEVGPRAMAMGGAFVSMADDYTALYYNPAGIALLPHNEIGLAHTTWILDIRHSFLGATFSPGPNFGTIGVSVNYLDMGEMERTTPSEPDGDGTFFSPSDMAIGLAYARKLTDRFSVGGQAKLIRETISYSSANTFAVDLGTHFVTGFHGLRVGMSISNFGGKMLMRGTDQMVNADIDPVIDGNPDKESRLETEEWPIPLTFRFGMSMDVMDTETGRLTVSADFNDPRDMAPYGTFGGEFGWNDMVFLRGGMQYTPNGFDETIYEEDGDIKNTYDVHFAFGGGLLLPIPGSSLKMRLDYAYKQQYMLDNSHRFAFSIQF